MSVRSTTNLVLLALVSSPLPVTAQESERPSVASFGAVAPGPGLPLPQSTGEKSAAVAGLLNALVFPGIGNFYAGNHGHGLRHVGIAVGGGVVAFAVIVLDDADDDDDVGRAVFLAAAVVVTGNWVWSIASGIKDAQAAGRPGGSGGAVTFVLRPQLVPLGLPHTAGYSPGMVKHRLGLQLVRVTF